MPQAQPNNPDQRGDLSVVPVDDRRDLEQFIRFPWTIYADDPHWVPPLLFERRAHLNRKSNPYFSHAEAKFWLACRDGVPVGRISAQVDQLSLARHKDATGHFGFLEARDDPEIFSALLGVAEAWLKERGMARARGPFSLSINDEAGVLVEGFDTPPQLMMGHAPPYYAAQLEAQGYAKAQDLIAYHFDMRNNPVPPIARRLIDRLRSDPDYSIRPLRWRHFSKELKTIVDIFNDAWSDNWGFVPFTESEIAHLGENLLPVIRKKMVCIIEYQGEPVAFGVALINLNEVVRDLNGRVWPTGWAKLAWRLLGNRFTSTRLPLMGVRKVFRNSPVGAALAYTVIEELYRGHQSHGLATSELSWILEENIPIRKIIESCQGEPYKTYRVYEKDLM